MHKRYLARHFIAASGLLLLTACGGGTGGTDISGTPSGTGNPSNNSNPSGNNNNTPVTYQIQAAAAPTIGPNTPLEEFGGNVVSGPSGQTTAPVGTVFPLTQTAMSFDILDINTSPATAINSGGITLTYQGTGVYDSFTVGKYELRIPGLNIDAVIPIVGNGTVIPSTNYVFTDKMQFLTYTMAGRWELSPLAGHDDTPYYGDFVTGFQTPATALPTSGQATYSGSTFNALGTISYNNPIFTGSYNGATVAGNASVTVNFATGIVNGSITNTVATETGGYGFPWNNVGLTGTLSGAAISGNTAATSLPATSTPLTFDASSTGTFRGALYGPAGQELGAVWTLHDPTGAGKTAIGTIVGAR